MKDAGPRDSGEQYVRRVRPPAVAGTFYPSGGDALAELVDRLLRDAAAEALGVTGAPAALIVPHAGYAYSGEVAARGYAQLLPWRQEIRRIVLLGPAHRWPGQGVALPRATALATPLGEVEIDAEGAALALRSRAVLRDDLAHRGEHSLEVQLPFLQRVLTSFTLVPLAVGRTDPSDVAELIATFLDRPATIVIVSSDLSHYLLYDDAVNRDRTTARQIVALVPLGIDHDDACGAAAVNGLILAARRAGLTARLLELRNSGDTAGPSDAVVGYGAFAFDRCRVPR